MKVPGPAIGHYVITPGCREAQGGDLEALEVALNRVRKKFRQHLEVADEELLERQEFHLVLTAETEKG